ncbi:putative ubiquitin-protein ligase (Asi3) [Aspergillus clavatus NRRL 1]|uniref:Ubiquitin-protein ligase (Asi3), putative n=1 Tax=Aspergillus clavatus (strain ATCC 1007 / CBS 513.65 / DSM 816 / NCTC 3887 / NRRL 1 / QM 1276 / 107) TaxID=344612 RepID=A1CTU9_ASPCL|nr:ubiquitin-protein ligase (Asi3), putative [Aspergillus clavatus NRRL 1]EAW06736.1 ubiquitin-protein ligase (Asi3), putative [Aspergillus clavatus NRRL 1]
MSVAQETAAFSATSAATASLSAIPSINSTTVKAATGYSLLSSSPRELLAMPFRGLRQLETFSFSAIPRQLSRLVGVPNLATRWAGHAPGTGVEGDAAMAAAHAAAGAAGDGMADAAAQAETGVYLADFFQAMRRFSGFFSYLTSRWSLACFAVALILNRITIYASTRRPLTLDFHRRMALRIIPIVLFMAQILALLRGIRCQTSPDYGLYRYGTPGKRLSFDHAAGGGFLYSLSSTLLPWESDEQSCSAVRMNRSANGTSIPYGSYVFIWPVFLRLCLSHFVETLSCALQGRAVVTEAGMSIFEHSLAFAEAESMISQSIGLGLFGLPKQGISKDSSSSGEPAHPALQLLSRAQVLERMNVTPELLLIALISCCNSLTSNILDVLGKQSRYRLFNTAFWGLCFMSAMVWGLLTGSPVGSDAGVLKFPTVCIVGFVPHLLILLGIVTCGIIYALALAITAFSLPPDMGQPLSLRQRFSLAHENMQGANQIRNIRFNWHEDFYTTLLRIGYTSLTAASEAVFLNEGKTVVARRMTWLEEERVAEIERSRHTSSFPQNLGAHDRDVPFTGVEPVTFDVSEPPAEWETGYGKEKKIEKPKGGSRSVRSQVDPGGVGAFRGAARCYHGFSFFRGIFFLLLKWTAFGFDRVLYRFGISARPQWLKKLVGSRGRASRDKNQNTETDPLPFWILTADGEVELPGDNEFDVETEMRKRENSATPQWGQSEESHLDGKLYAWWKAGGSWGNQDQSPDYIPTDNNDTTSVISMSTTTESEWEEESDGRRTPTPRNPYPVGLSREGSPVDEPLMDLGSFARLLDPRDQESRHEARILAAHLAAGREGRIMTRREFQRQIEHDRAQVLLSSKLSHLGRPQGGNEKRRPTPEEESEMLEKLILSKRSEANRPAADGQTWESGASGLGPDGPQCVICQTNPRSIITWPCRCLCVCEECRVSLAMNNFGSCVTCRQEVGGFVRLWNIDYGTVRQSHSQHT